MNPTRLRCEYTENPLDVATGHPRFSWRLGELTATHASQHAYRLRVGSCAQKLQQGAPDCWDSGLVQTPSTTHVVYAGVPLRSSTRYFWSVEVYDRPDADAGVMDSAWFETTLLDETDWLGAQWIGVVPMWIGRPVYFRTTFNTASATEATRLYVAGLGCHYVWVNGQLVGDRLLEPPATDYGARVLFTTYNLDGHVVAGRNILVIACGPGWHGTPQFKARLLQRGIDGRETNIVSGVPTCQFFARVGGWLAAGIYDGETFDARLHPTHWLNSTELNDWRLPEPAGTLRTESHFNARRVPAPGGKLIAHTAEPIRITRRLPPKATTQPAAGRWVVDFGENISGFVELRPRLPSGTAVTLRFAEFLSADGRTDQTNLYTAACCDRYICRGTPDEFYRPLFTVHGFRYVEIEGFEGEVGDDTFTACHVRSDVAQRGSFECSDEMVNRLQRAVVLCEANNQHGLLTDCPQRAERMGWLNDPTARIVQAVHNFDLNRLLEKWLDDIADTQDATGAIADTAPFYWGSRPADPVCIAPALIPWLLWRHHGNHQALEKHYPTARRWHRYLASRSSEHILELSHYGDWCPPIAYGAPNNWGNSISRDTPGSLVSTALWLELTDLLQKTAKVLHRDEEARQYATLGREIRAAFHARFFDPVCGGYGANNQAANSLALCLGIPPPEHVAGVARNLTADVEIRGHLSTGNICTKYLLNALSLIGRSDLAFQLVTRREYPGWGFMLENGATTLWERWELNTSAGMNSHNHPMLGSVGGWFYEHLLGIRDDESAPPGERFILSPYFAPSLTHANGSLETPQGRLTVKWKRVERLISVQVEVPPQTSIMFLAGDETRHLGAGEHMFSISPTPMHS